MSNLFSIADQLISRNEKEIRLGQKAKVFWFTGLSGSGKSTLAVALERKLFELGYHVIILDGDTIRTGINNNLSFSPEDRIENIRRIAEMAKLFVGNGLITIVSFISPTRDMRAMAKNIIGENDFVETYIDTPLEICEARDIKGLYKKARAGEITDFTGISAPYEPPILPDIHIHTAGQTIELSTKQLLEATLREVRLS